MLTSPPIPRIDEAAAPIDVSSQADELDRMIAEAAYYIAQQRGFEPGHEIDDWLAAEAQVLDQLSGHR